MRKVKFLLVYPNLMLVNTLPNNIGILAAVIKNAGHNVRLFDTTLYHTSDLSNDEMRVKRMQIRKFDIHSYGVSLKDENVYHDFVRCVTEYQPDIIGVSLVQDTLTLGLYLIESIPSEMRSIPI